MRSARKEATFQFFFIKGNSPPKIFSVASHHLDRHVVYHLALGRLTLSLFLQRRAGPAQVFAARVAGSSRFGPLVLEEAAGERGGKKKQQHQQQPKKKSEAVGVSARCREGEGTINGKLLPFILQVARVLATGGTESRASQLRCVWFVDGGLNGRFPHTQRLKLPHCNRRRSSSEVEEEEEEEER